jgi:uncharacterized membrane protein
LSSDSRIYATAAVVGATAGLRSFSAPTVISYLSRQGLLPAGSKLRFLARPSTGVTAAVLAAGEVIADKLPFVPRRTKLGPLTARALSGGLAGAAIFSSRKKPVWTGILIGAGAAIGATYAAYELRKRAAERLNIPDPILAIVEDAVVAASSYAVISRMGAQTEPA